MEERQIRIDTVRDILLRVYGVYFSACSRENLEMLQTNAPNEALQRGLIAMDAAGWNRKDGKPFSAAKIYFYGNEPGMIWTFCVDGDMLYLLGPVFSDSYSVLDILNALEGKLSPSVSKSELVEYIARIPVASSHRLQQYIQMLHCTLLDQKATFLDVEVLGRKRVPEVPQEEPGNRSAGYVLEQKLWKAVRDGNVGYLRELETYMNNVTIGRISNGDFLRQDKNVAICQVALTCRAAVEGGLSPEIAYPLSDRYIQRIEECATVAQVMEISVGIIDDYIQRVHRAKQRSGISAQVGDCCDYISMHPEENPDIRRFAQKYGYTPYYFSKKFKQETGCSLRAFAIGQKIARAKELLREGSLSVADIGAFLGFNSQSYFGSVFKEYTGVSPGEYRERGGTGIMEETE